MTVDEFITKWENCPGHERANYAVYLTELTHVLGVEAPGPTDIYRIDAQVPGGAEAGGTGFIDLYKHGSHQFYGLEKNPRAAKIAELVLWIGWLRNRLHDDPDSVPQPVLAESANINFGRHGGYDAVLKMNELGQPDLYEAARQNWRRETSKHRVFQFVDSDVLPDHAVIAIGSDDAFHLGVLQSGAHQEWTLRSGAWLGYGNDNRYSKSKTFDPFPFPDGTPEQRTKIADLAEELDAMRKAALAETDKLTMTELYNLRESVRSGAPMDDKEQRRATKARPKRSRERSAGFVPSIRSRASARRTRNDANSLVDPKTGTC